MTDSAPPTAAAVREHPTVAAFRREGATCALCGGGAYPPWLTDDETWRNVMGDSQQQVCLPCFNDRVESGEPLRILLHDAYLAALERVTILEAALEAAREDERQAWRTAGAEAELVNEWRAAAVRAEGRVEELTEAMAKTEQFIRGLRDAAARGENVGFH